jgi:antirestriction protein
MRPYRIYVASLADYNAGRMYGAWIDAEQDAEGIEAEVRAMLAQSTEPNAEEWAIHDYELGGVKISESESFERVAAIAEALVSIDDEGSWTTWATASRGAFIAWLENYGDGLEPDEWGDAFREAYAGTYDCVEDYARRHVEDTGMLDNVDANIARYFDFEAFADDLEMGGDIWTEKVPGGVAVFINY